MGTEHTTLEYDPIALVGERQLFVACEGGGVWELAFANDGHAATAAARKSRDVASEQSSVRRATGSETGRWRIEDERRRGKIMSWDGS